MEVKKEEEGEVDVEVEEVVEVDSKRSRRGNR
jgi:hypothetical protein